MWKHYQVTLEDPMCRSCGTFSAYAGKALLGRSELEWETIEDQAFHRHGSFEAVLETYLCFQDLFVRYQNLKLEQHLRLPAYKQMPELDKCEAQIRGLPLRLVAPNGEEVPTQHLAVV